MPLRALIDGREVIAPALTDEAWERLRETVAERGLTVILPCCGAEGYLRRSGTGTPHFAHKRGADKCALKGETIHHLNAKAAILRACQAAGYDALPEVAGDDWRADILATRGSVRIAFEVQWSFLRLKDAVYRQSRYERDDVRGCWFFRNPPKPLQTANGLKARHDLPLFHLWGNADGSFSVALAGKLHPLPTFVTALLAGKIRYCEQSAAALVQQLDLTFFDIPCPTCRRPTPIYHAEPRLSALCGFSFNARGSWYGFAMRSDVRRAALAAAAGRGTALGAVRRRVVNGEGDAYPTFGCRWCDAALDQTYVTNTLYGAHQLEEARAADAIPITVRLDKPLISRNPHWCFPPSGDFCCDAS